VVVLPAAIVDTTLEAGRARLAKEDGWLAELQAGATTVDLLGLR
jgi:hypothetical protein